MWGAAGGGGAASSARRASRGGAQPLGLGRLYLVKRLAL